MKLRWQLDRRWHAGEQTGECWTQQMLVVLHLRGKSGDRLRL